MIGIYSYISFNDFVDGFKKAGRGDQFSYEGLAELYSYYNELSTELNSAIEFDPIAICCDWVESSKEEITEDYDLCEDEDVERFLNNETIFFELDNDNFLYQQF